MARNSHPSPSVSTAGDAVQQDEDTIIFTVLQPVRVDGIKFMPDEPAPVPYDLVQHLDARGIIGMREQG